MATGLIKRLTPQMRLVWHAASLTVGVGIAAFLHNEGYSLAEATLVQFICAVVAFFLLSLLLRLFVQQAADPQELLRHFFLRRRR